jgi:hypothetical protein
LTGSIWFRFYKPETEKTEPNPNRKKTKPNWKKPSQNRTKPGLNQFFSLKNQTEPNQTKTGRLNRFRFGFVFFKKKFQFGYFFSIKTKSN